MSIAATPTSYRTLASELIKMTWPMMFGIVSIMSFQLVDSAFIGQLGVLPLAAQGFTLPIQLIIIGLQVGLGIATTALISKALGAAEITYAKQLGGLVILIGSAGLALICGILWIGRGLILDLLSAPESVHAIIDGYWPYWLLSAWVGAFLYFFYSICRSHGNTMLPGSMMVVTSLLNIALDPIFIFTFDLGINGAAIATIVAFGIGVLIVAPKVFLKQWISFHWQDLNLVKSLLSIANIMGPAMVSQLLPPVSSMLATKLIAGFGAAAVAAWALGSRVEFFIIVAVLALTMSMPPMVGRLLGAKKLVDIRALIKMASGFILVFQFFLAAIVMIFSGWLADVMTSDQTVSGILNWHLLIIPMSLGPLGICMLIVSVANALGRSYRALTISALRLFAFFLPCIWLGAYLGDIHGLFVGVLVGNICAGVCAWMMYQSLMKQVEQRLL